MHEVLVNRLGGLSLPRKSVVRLTDRPDMTLDVYRGRKTTIQPTSLCKHGKEAYTISRYFMVENNAMDLIRIVFPFQDQRHNIII